MPDLRAAPWRLTVSKCAPCASIVHRPPPDSAGPPVLLHGFLEIAVLQAKHLRTSCLPSPTDVKLYVDVDVGVARVARTRELRAPQSNPVWNQTFLLYSAYPATAVTFTVKKQGAAGAEVVGIATVPVARIASCEPFLGWLSIRSERAKRWRRPQLLARLLFSNVASDPHWGAGVPTPQFGGLTPAFFPLRTDCSVTLYQNAHLSSSYSLPESLVGSRERYGPSRCWEDLFVAIQNARHFICVAGWSVNTAVKLVRDPTRMIAGAVGVTFGELLKRKADEGVAVLVMVWNDRTSVSLLGNAGLMDTHDEETRKFFEGSRVKCFLCPRNADRSLTLVQQIEIGLEFTHHQKTITVDTAMIGANDSRHIVSFIGGIDVTDGRYDDEKHTLFGKLDTVYHDDFLQNNLIPRSDIRRGGPREPWHDVHCRLEGPAARDVLTNFQQRWKKQAPPDIAHYADDIDQEAFPDPPVLDDGEKWSVQVFRSIDDSSVVGFPTDPAGAVEGGLVSAKNTMEEQSIHGGYIEAIRRAKRFIYVENQYFIGSCAAWKEDQGIDCINLVPVEIALKIASKIRRRERFAAYIVVPMWPEGEPEGETVQAILHWSRLTMEMMYGIVAAAINDANMRGKAHPCDYLNFFCLGNRESRRQPEYIPAATPEEGSDYYRAQVNRRFMIYVHAKLLIVDDEYVIVGSANINQRSLAGDRDTEIAVGAFQPAHLAANSVNECPQGHIHGFRMSLWYEHFLSSAVGGGGSVDVYRRPESIECVRAVREAAEMLWLMYIQDTLVDLPGHLLPFPVTVSATGQVSDRPEDGLFPDTRAPVSGRRSQLIPPIITS